MPTVMTHAAVALALGPAFRRAGWPRRVWWVGAGCAMLPDADVIGIALGVPFGSMLGHRGLTHSLPFAAVLAAALAPALVREARGWLWLYLFLATASHGLLDAMTDGGIGIAFFAPFDATYYLPWRPILVSPITARAFLGEWGLRVLVSEAVWVWLPAAVVAAIAWRLATRDPRPQG